jgi:hypothetical protein
LVPVLEMAQQNDLSKPIVEHVDLPSTRVAFGAMNPAGKLTSIIAAVMCGADSIEDANLLCADGTPRVFDEVYAAQHVRVPAEAGANAGVKIGSLIAGMIAAWLEIIMAATDLIARAKPIGFTDHPELARCEIAAFLPLPGATHRRPHHLWRLTTTAAHRLHLALGTGHRHRLAPHPHHLHLTLPDL